MREYKIAKGWAIFIYITAPMLIALFVWLLLLPFLPGSTTDKEMFWLLGPISLGMIVLMVLGVLDTIKGKFVIDTDRIYTVSVFSTRELLLTEIKGYRIADKYLFIESNNEAKKTIKVSTYLANVNEIKDWLSDHYSDLDVVQILEENKEILQNETFGWTEEEREQRLIKARKITKVLNWSGTLICAWTLFLAKPYEYAIIVSLVFPVICAIVLKYFNGLIRIDERKDSAYPSIFMAVFTACLGLCLRALLDYNIFNYANVWTPAIVITLSYIAFLLIGNKEFRFSKSRDYFTVVSISLFMFGYGYGAVVGLNCMLDKSEPETFKAAVLSKRISSGKHTTYYVKLSPWGQLKAADEVSVSKSLYNVLENSDTVTIYFMKGRFDIPWFEVRK